MIAIAIAIAMTITKLLTVTGFFTAGMNAAHPGVGPVVEEGEIVSHKYYQWVCFTLFFQAMCFLGPYHLWKYWEGGTRIKYSVTRLYANKIQCHEAVRV